MYGFIYITTNHINGKQYIGQRKYDKQNKWKDYLGSGIVLSKAIKKYGVENFSKEIIENCETKKELNNREKFWINYYNAVNSCNFYNIAKGGDGGNTLAGYTEEQLEDHSKILSNALKGNINQGLNNPRAKQVICLNNMKVFDTTVEAAKYANVCDVTIQSCCNGRTYTAGKDPVTNESLQWEYYYPDRKYKLKTIKKKNNHPNIKKVICYTTGKIFNSAKEGAEYYKLSESGIYSCCNFVYSYYGKLENDKKLQWFYYDYYISKEFDISKHPIKESNSDKIFTVYMYNLNGEFEEEFSSQRNAIAFIGDHINGAAKILQCCNGKRDTAFGHIWRFYKKDIIDISYISNYSKPKNRPIKQYTASMEFVNQFDNLKEASLHIKNDYSAINAIRQCCNNRSKTSYGYIWRYAS